MGAFFFQRFLHPDSTRHPGRTENRHPSRQRHRFDHWHL